MKTLKAVGLLNLSFAVFSILFLSSCSDDMTNTVDNRDGYELKVWDYSDNHYFLDTVYKASFVDYYNNTNISQQTANLAVDEQSFEVWVQPEVIPQYYRLAAMHVDLPAMPVNGYDDSLKTVPTPEQGMRTFSIVRRLEQNEYVLNKYAGYISLKINLPENYFAGVAYKVPGTGNEFGTISTDTSAFPNDTLILKMVKVQNLIPQNTLAWELKLRNIYQLPKTNIVQTGFEFEVMYLSNGIWSQSLPVQDLNKDLIMILDLDKYTFEGIDIPDGKFDYLPDKTINEENGWIIFPTLKPFEENMKNKINGIYIDSVYWYTEIYHSLKSESKTVPNAINYRFQVYISK